MELLRKLLSAKKMKSLQRVVRTGDLSTEPWLAYQLHLSQKFAPHIETFADAGTTTTTTKFIACAHYADIYVAFVSDKIGWGAFAAKRIEKGSYVGECVSFCSAFVSQ